MGLITEGQQATKRLEDHFTMLFRNADRLDSLDLITFEKPVFIFVKAL